MFKSAASSTVYADYNATAPLRKEAREAMLVAMEIGANASSVHGAGRKAKAVIERGRDQVAMAIGACRDDLFFTSGGTEANFSVLKGACAADPSLRLIVSAIEHDAVLAQFPDAERAPVTADGVIDLDWLRHRMAEWISEDGRPFLSLMFANNETGVIQPVADAARLVHDAGGLIHSDAVQGLGKVQLSVVDLEVDYLTLSAHKIGGPQGVGAVFLAAGAPYICQITGGGQEMGRRAGTENVAGIAGFGAACDAAVSDLDGFAKLAQLREKLENRLKTEGGVTIIGERVARIANTTCLAKSGFRSETQVMAMDLAGVAVSSGSACSSGKVRRSHVLSAMNISPELADGALRISFGWQSTPDDHERVADAWLAAAMRAGQLSTPKKETA
ncbi:MAG: aminotransferase [Hirschia sp.]|nr:aminotransferase [Hirschia sp.]MBF20078.1 aminotransferase [Hirschia sp.]